MKKLMLKITISPVLLFIYTYLSTYISITYLSLTSPRRFEVPRSRSASDRKGESLGPGGRAELLALVALVAEPDPPVALSTSADTFLPSRLANDSVEANI